MAYNSFWFHYEVIGFILEYANSNNLHIDLVQEVPNDGWDELYHSKFNYTSLTTIPEADVYSKYQMVFLLTDDDAGFPDKLVDNRTVCLDHYYENRRPVIQHHIPIKPFPNKHNGINWAPYVIPAWRFVSLQQKLKLLEDTVQTGSRKPVIAFLGNGHPKDPHLMVSAFSNAADFEIRIIAHKIPRAPWHNVEKTHGLTVSFHQSVSALEMFQLLSTSHYVAFINHHDDKHGEGKSLTSSIPNGFTAGCKLVLPVGMNKFLGLRSAVLLEEGKPVFLPNTVEDMDLPYVFQEREKLIEMRDNALNQFRL